MRAPLALSLLLSSFAVAATYEVPLGEVDDEDDIIALEDRGDISAETADILLELISEGVDLNAAGRDELYDLPGISYADADAILLYRKNKGHIDDPTELVAAGALTEGQLLLIIPFIRLDSGPTRLPVSGKFRLRAASSNGDFLDTGAVHAPPALLEGKVKLPWDLSTGFAFTTTGRQFGSPTYDELNNALKVEPRAYRFTANDAWGMWKAGQRKVVVGTFTLGFAERVTLDNTRRYTPSGIYVGTSFRRPRDASRSCTISISGASGGTTLQELPCATEKDLYVTPDFAQVRQGFRGVAGSIEDLEFGDGQKLSLFGFLSYQTRNVYQYDLYDAAACEDPREDSNRDCKAPVVRVGDGTDPTHLIFSTLHYLYEELIGGVHADFKPNDRYRIGLTGYGATNFWHDAPLKLDMQEGSRVPFGGPFGAVGVDARAQFGDFGLFLEGSRTFDSIKAGPLMADLSQTPAGGGGFGVEQRTVYSPRNHELELSLRYYDNKFLNPYARPISAPDEFEGQRARNEAGARLKYLGRLPRDFELRASANFWLLPFTNPGQPPAGTTNLYTLLRLDYVGYKLIEPAVLFEMKNRNLPSSQHGVCASGTIVLVADGETYTCSGDSYRLSAQVTARPLGRLLSGRVLGSITWKDDVRYKDRFRTDLRAVAEVVSQPVDFLQLKLRTRYLNEDSSDDTYLETSLWTYLRASLLLTRNFHFSLRYDVYAFLDKRDSSLSRIPNPEHRFFVDITAGF
jgi:hypothetical protein